MIDLRCVSDPRSRMLALSTLGLSIVRLSIVRLRIAVPVIAGLISGCPSPTDTAEWVGLAEPHVEAFVRFEQWAHRTLSAQVEMRNMAARHEALFAPLGLESDVLGARVSGERSYEFREPGGSSEVQTSETQWRALHVGNEELDVSRGPDRLGLARDAILEQRRVRVEMWFALVDAS